MWLKIYNFNPLIPNIEKSRILGAELVAFGELIIDENIYLKIWPRATTFSERLWKVS